MILEKPKLPKFICKKCNHIWNQRLKNKPLACPRCKRYDWEKGGNENGK